MGSPYLQVSHTRHAMLGPCCVGSPYLQVSHTQYAMPGPCCVGSLYLHGLHTQHAMWGLIFSIVWGPHIFMALTHTMLCWGLRLSIVWGPHICACYHMAMGLTYMLTWNSIVRDPHIYSTWVSHTACYAGAYTEYSVGSPHLHAISES